MHVDADSFVVTVDAGPVRGFASHLGATDPCEDGADDLIAQGEQGGDGARGQRRDVVAAGTAGLVDEPFAAEFTQVVAGLADVVVGVGGASEDVHLGGEFGHGEPVGRERVRSTTESNTCCMVAPLAKIRLRL
ncbi:hypothetical protein ACT16_23020 [Mycobacterium heckeshornense]|nr:hypothetical protein ACT16_23020 [Mycobacterium heckeshornense]